jgi:EmrB/QacA subfamily drug resistance transporter
MLIVCRALLGLAGAMIMPSTLSILTNVFQDPKERVKAIAIWSSVFSVGAGVGPIIGGLLINAFHWSSVFFLNLPIVLVGIIGGIIFVPESKDANAPQPDLPGVGLSTIGLFSLIFGVIQAGDLGWTASPVLLSFGIAFVFLYAFIRWENHSSSPMLPMVFFKNMDFTGANVSLTISAFAMMGSMYFFSQFLQSVQGYSPIVAALSMFPMTLSVITFTMLSVRMDRKMGTKFTMSLGLLLSGAGLFLFSLVADVHTPYAYILLVQIVLGSGIGFTISPATNMIMSSLPPSRAGIGSAMNDTTRQLGGALGVAVLGALMNGAYRTGVSALAGANGITGALMEQIRSSIQGAHVAAASLGTGLAQSIIQTSSQSFVHGMNEALLVASVIMVLASITAWVLVPDKRAVAAVGKV